MNRFKFITPDGQYIPVLINGLPPVIQYEDGDPIIHTDLEPECSDPDCPCHWAARTQEQSFAVGACPICGLDFSAHSAWLNRPGDTTCVEVE